MIPKVKGIHSGLEEIQRNSLSLAQVAGGSGDSLLPEPPSKRPGCPLPVIRVADIHTSSSLSRSTGTLTARNPTKGLQRRTELSAACTANPEHQGSIPRFLFCLDSSKTGKAPGLAPRGMRLRAEVVWGCFSWCLAVVSIQPSCPGHTRVPWARDVAHMLVELKVSRAALAFFSCLS